MVLMSELKLNANAFIHGEHLVVEWPGVAAMVITDRGCTYTLKHKNGDYGPAGATKTFREAFSKVSMWMEKRDVE